jgi:bifunctional DNA-binding transcriptional regulator/antitoxin component of YhaV-PrlF toxin-antitoxin module
MVTRMRDKGQVTIPISIREALHLDKESVLSIVKVGDTVLMVPKALVFDSVAAKFQKAAKESGITLEDLLKDLRKIRHEKS